MSDILFIKTSSLGEVIHHMPAVTDARRHRPDARIGWVVEEAFAPLVRLHGAVDSVIPVASRRWRRAPFRAATWQEIGAFKRAMREQTHETVIDAQGLFRSALITRFARETGNQRGAKESLRIDHRLVGLLAHRALERTDLLPGRGSERCAAPAPRRHWDDAVD